MTKNREWVARCEDVSGKGTVEFNSASEILNGGHICMCRTRSEPHKIVGIFSVKHIEAYTFSTERDVVYNPPVDIDTLQDVDRAIYEALACPKPIPVMVAVVAPPVPLHGRN